MTSSASSGTRGSIEEGFLSGRAGGAPKLAYTINAPSGAKAAIAMLHGYGEHRARYIHVTRLLAAAGIATVIFDQRGHGVSDGPRGHCDDFGEYHQDFGDILSLFQQQMGNAPLFMFGHSFGGLVATTYALANPSRFRGLVLTSPFFGLALAVPAAKIALGEVASRLYGRLGVPSGLRGADVTHDPIKADEYDRDPLNLKKATARWFTESKAAQRDLLARAAQLRTPVLLIQAGADRIASPSAARSVFDRLGSADKTYDEKKGLFHEILNESSWQETTEQIQQWVLTRAS